MRSDMSKVVVERPRLGRQKTKHFREKQRTKNDLESSKTKEPMRSRLERTKSFNEHLKPLWRWLLKQVGRPWDKVKSEAIQALGGGKGTLQDHVITHLKGYVDENVTLIHGVPYVITHLGMRPVANEYSRKNYTSLYCCPKTGLLKIAKRPKTKTERFEIYRLEATKAILVYKDTWYCATLKKFPEPVYDSTKHYSSQMVFDAWLEKEVGAMACERLWGTWGKTLFSRLYYAESVRTLKKVEVKGLPLSVKV